MSDTYWQDYTRFIEVTEKISGLSPADLLSRYEILIEELEDTEKDIFEWIYENTSDKYTRAKIQLVLDSGDLKNNVLKNEFQEKINGLDTRMKRFLKDEYTKRNWKEIFSDEVIDWKKVKK